MGLPKTVRFEEELEDEVEKYLEANGIKFSQLLNLAVSKFISEPQTIQLAPVESAISTAFYPGVYPFAHDEFTRVAGALCFYLVKSHAFTDGNKRTAPLVAITYLNQHGLDLSLYSALKMVMGPSRFKYYNL